MTVTAIRLLLLVVLLLFFALFLATTFAQSADARLDASQYFSREDIDRGLRFSSERRLIFWAGTALDLGLLTALVFTGWARKLSDGFLAWTRNRWLLAVLLVGAFCFLAEQAVALPIGIVRLEQLRSWDMTHRPVAAWLEERCLGMMVSGGLGGVSLVGLYLLIRFFPRAWWFLAAVGGMLLGVAYAFLLPVLIAPLFNTFTPLSATRWSDLQGPVQELARRAGIPVHDVLVVDASRQSSHTNAYFTGFGGTRRIVLYDTLLKAHTGAEVESILAHEMGHWQHHHILKGIALATLAALGGFFVLSRILVWAVGRPPFLLRSPHDPAGIPLVLLLSTLGLWLALPVENAVSRHFERQADAAALELTGQADVFIAAEKRLARENLSNVAPAPFTVWLFSSHPPAVERIRMAEEWKREHGSSP
jgi:STE24 endopeptidase